MRTIVVASDAPSVRADVVAVVSQPGTDIIEVDSGFDVAPAVDEHEPDLVIVDLQMGNMGGVAVCHELRLEESYGNLPHVPVLMLLDRRADVFLARRTGAEGWIVKPLDPIRLRRATTLLVDGGIFHDESFQPVPVLSAAGGAHRDHLDAGGSHRDHLDAGGSPVGIDAGGAPVGIDAGGAPVGIDAGGD